MSYNDLSPVEQIAIRYHIRRNHLNSDSYEDLCNSIALDKDLMTVVMEEYKKYSSTK